MGKESDMDGPLHLRSRQWSCSELDAGMHHMVAVKTELNEDVLETRAKDICR